MSAQSKQESLSTESYEERGIKSVSTRSKKVKKHKADLAYKPGNEEEKNSNAETNTQYSMGQRMPTTSYTIPQSQTLQQQYQPSASYQTSQQSQPMPVTQRQRPPSALGPSAAPTNKKERNKPIQISDPNMGRDVIEEILHLKSTPLGGSACSTPGSSRVLESAGNRWVPRRDENKPKTIEQIHREAKQEEIQRHMISQINAQQPMKRNRSPRGPSQGGQGGMGEYGWITVRSKARKRNTERNIDLSKLRINKSSDDNIQLGTGGGSNFGGWGRGSNGGGSRPSQEGERPNT